MTGQPSDQRLVEPTTKLRDAVLDAVFLTVEADMLADQMAHAAVGTDALRAMADAAASFGVTTVGSWRELSATRRPADSSDGRFKVGEVRAGTTVAPAVVGPAVEITGDIHEAARVTAGLCTRLLADAGDDTLVVVADELGVFPSEAVEVIEEAGFSGRVCGLREAGEYLSAMTGTDRGRVVALLSGSVHALGGDARSALQALVVAGGHLVGVWNAPSGISGTDLLVLRSGRSATWEVGGTSVPLRIDDPPDRALVGEVARRWAESTRAATESVQGLDALVPDELLAANSADGLAIPVGVGAEGPWALRFDEHASHGLVIGATGTGKTTLFHTLVHSAASRYPASELHIWLVDMKQGTGFATYVPQPGRPSLPQVRVVAASNDRAFALAVLEHLVDQIDFRAKLFKSQVPRVDSLAAYRATDQRLPRVLAVIDEFQVLFDRDDNLAERGWDALNTLSRQGRAYGIHLLLGSQHLGGLQGAILSRREGIFSNLAIRVDLATHHQSQQRTATVSTIKDRPLTVTAADPHDLEELRSRIADASGAPLPTPFVYDDTLPPTLSEVIDHHHPAALDGPRVRFGRAVAVDRDAAVELDPAPGRNVAVFTAAGNTDLAVGALSAGAVSAALNYPPGHATFVIVDLLPEGSDHEHVPRLLADIALAPDGRLFDDLGEALSFAAETDGPVFTVVFGLDPAHDGLGELLAAGPPAQHWYLTWWADTTTLTAAAGRKALELVGVRLAIGHDPSEANAITGRREAIPTDRAALYDGHQPTHGIQLIPYPPPDEDLASSIPQQRPTP